MLIVLPTRLLQGPLLGERLDRRPTSVTAASTSKNLVEVGKGGLRTC